MQKNYSHWIFTLLSIVAFTSMTYAQSGTKTSLIDTPGNAVELIPDATHKNIGGVDNSPSNSGQTNPPLNFITTKKEVDLTQHKINPNVVMDKSIIDNEIEALKKEKKKYNDDIDYVNEIKKQIKTLKARKQYLQNNNLLLN